MNPLNPPTELIPQEIMENFLDLACALSPENLTCDGELSRSSIDKRYASIMAEWKRLEKSVGRKVTEDEVWQWEMSS